MFPRSRRSRSPLSRLMFPEMTCRAVLYPPPPHPGTVLMPVIIDDAFYDDLGASLPARSLSFLLPAASWSARNSKSGFVPAWQVAKLSDDPDRDMGPLQAAGIARRVKGGGMQVVAGKGLVIVNADAAAAEVERKREQGRIRSQRKRDRDKAVRGAAIAAGVTRDAGAAQEKPQAGTMGTVDDGTPASRSPDGGVTRAERSAKAKRQVSGTSVTRYEPGSSRVTERPSRARARTDFDFSQREENQVSQSGVSDARAHADEPPPGSPEFRFQVIAEFAAATGDEIDDATADAITAEVLGKSKKKPVTHPLPFVLTAIASDPSPRARWLPHAPPASQGVPKRLKHCGDRECSPVTRRRENPLTGADEGPCPKCSGTVAAWVEAG